MHEDYILNHIGLQKKPPTGIFMTLLEYVIERFVLYLIFKTLYSGFNSYISGQIFGEYFLLCLYCKLSLLFTALLLLLQFDIEKQRIFYLQIFYCKNLKEKHTNLRNRHHTFFPLRLYRLNIMCSNI